VNRMASRSSSSGMSTVVFILPLSTNLESKSTNLKQSTTVLAAPVNADPHALDIVFLDTIGKRVA
jgi:hypothetical protein